MYEIWLALNIVYETLLPAWPVWLLLMALWLGFAFFVWTRPGARWRAALPSTLLLALVAGILAFLLIPGAATQSSLGELAYWVDWLFLSSLAVGAAALAAAVGWPVLALLKGKTPGR